MCVCVWGGGKPSISFFFFFFWGGGGGYIWPVMPILELVQEMMFVNTCEFL